jgi:C-terminal processing protease CtpA/Prc
MNLAPVVQGGRQISVIPYRVVLPVAAYFTWHGSNLEGRGVVPHIEEPISPEALWNGEDTRD